jgi:ABC-type glycerol-3-phosphate transport system substrate-binding protein
VEGGLLVTYGPDYTILRSGDVEQLAAWLFIRWMAAPERQARWVEATDLLPLRGSVLEMIAPYRAAAPQWDEAVSYLPLAQGTPQLASWGRVRYLLEDGLNFIFQADLPLEGLPSVLDEMQSMAEELSAGQ